MISPMTICYALKLTHDFARSKYVLERTDYNRKTLEELSCAVEEIDAGKFEIEGYERVQWTKLNPNDPKTFPPRDEYIDIFIRSKEHEFRGVNKLTEFWLKRIVERWEQEVKHNGSVIYWRPLPPPPGKEEAR